MRCHSWTQNANSNTWHREVLREGTCALEPVGERAEVGHAKARVADEEHAGGAVGLRDPVAAVPIDGDVDELERLEVDGPGPEPLRQIPPDVGRELRRDAVVAGEAARPASAVLAARAHRRRRARLDEEDGRQRDAVLELAAHDEADGVVRDIQDAVRGVEHEVLQRSSLQIVRLQRVGALELEVDVDGVLQHARLDVLLLELSTCHGARRAACCFLVSAPMDVKRQCCG
mmetsp:Transcript_38118/g.89846  ORF Transcript_38118/g.89846 Transcript_38118/m.89846 type:complete len:230 (-) Transcript_38118:706-1395(-)